MGILDGYPGFMWSFMAGAYTLIKIAKTIELSENAGHIDYSQSEHIVHP